ncbi:MAG TPA: hypothetical protein VNJ04_10745 [Gemmatimonadaceae bacterium]|nr:hypothetical protein [Gemmatimonadaceae bacterium]
MRRLGLAGTMLLVFAPIAVQSQVVERPVPFDSAAFLMVITPPIASRAGLTAPTWPVAGEFSEARLYSASDSAYVMVVTRRSGVVERYNISPANREAIRVAVSRLPRETLERRNDARNAFIRNQTLLGIAVYGPAFATAIADNGASATAGYLVVAGGTFFAASEISRRMFISRAQNDLSTDTGLKGALGGWGLMYIFGADRKGQGAGAFIGGLGGTALGLRFGRTMTEAEAVGAGFGSTAGALIAFGVTEAFEKDKECRPFDGCVSADNANRGQVATILLAGLAGYPLGVLYPRNANYNVTPGDIQVLRTTGALGALTGGVLVSDDADESAAAAALTAGFVLGIVAGDRFLVQRLDHSRTDASRLALGTGAGALMGLGIAVLIDTDDLSPRLSFGLSALGGLAGLVITEKYIEPGADAGRRATRVSFNPAALGLMAMRAKGNHSLVTVRF